MAVTIEPLVAAAHAALEAKVARINALNVYPVPDGDTGTNMLLTLESVLKEASDKTYEGLKEATKAGARAALMGARGNSGVILSQMIRGGCEVLGDSDSLSAETVAAALEGACERAYASVRDPVEGTMLTVMRDAAHAALEVEDADIPAVIQTAAREAHASVRRTPELLEVLREAGVVDAGGLGVAVILDGLHAFVTGQEVEVPEEEGGVPDLEAIHAEDEAWGYCTEFVVTGFSGDAREFEERIQSSGKSVLVVSDEDLVKVHLHTQDPGDALSYGGRFGRLSGVKVEDMEDQVRSRGDGSGAAERKDLGVVAASRGEGSRKLFERMGAEVIEGGQGENPSAADFARAVQKTGARSVILLPNNKNIVPTAEQVHELVDGVEVHVVGTMSMAAGLAAMVGFDPEGEAGEVLEEMREITASLRCAEVTRAVREASIDGHKVPEGAYIGLLDGKLVAVEDGVEDAAIKLAERMLEGGVDIVTLLRGYGMDQKSAERVAKGIKHLNGEVDVEIKDGGQPLYPLQMVAE
jgi:fatty acid kinase